MGSWAGKIGKINEIHCLFVKWPVEDPGFGVMIISPNSRWCHRFWSMKWDINQGDGEDNMGPNSHFFPDMKWDEHIFSSDFPRLSHIFPLNNGYFGGIPNIFAAHRHPGSRLGSGSKPSSTTCLWRKLGALAAKKVWWKHVTMLSVLYSMYINVK